MSKLPVWARKPNHKKEVVATSRGWMVKETGEMLKLVKNLDERLKELHEESVESLSSISQTEPVDSIKQEDSVETEMAGDDLEVPETDTEDEKVESTETKPKRRGRPRKSDKS